MKNLYAETLKSALLAKNTFTIPLLGLAICSTPALADLPLKVDDMLTKKGNLRVELGMNYANADRRNVSSQFDLVQTGTGDFVLLPTEVGEERKNADILSMTTGLRYGLTDKTEIYTRLTGTASNIRSQQGSNSSAQSKQQWNDLIVGANHQFSADNDTPALFGFAEVSLAENAALEGSDIVSGKTAQVGLTTYKSIDPLVLSLTTGYRYAGKRKTGDNTVDPGDLVFVNPRVDFAVNERATLSGGLQLKYRGEDKVNGKKAGIATTSTDIELGLGYSLGKKTTLGVTTRSDISGDTGSQVGLNLLYDLG